MNITEQDQRSLPSNELFYLKLVNKSKNLKTRELLAKKVFAVENDLS